jgi:hypothetical protein
LHQLTFFMSVILTLEIQFFYLKACRTVIISAAGYCYMLILQELFSPTLNSEFILS